MTLQTTGAISFSDIATELEHTGIQSLRTMSELADKDIPDAMSEFYGFQNADYTVTGVDLSGTISSSSTADTQSYDLETVTVIDPATLVLNASITSAGNQSHSVQLFKNGSRMATIESEGTTNFDSVSAEYADEDTIQVKVLNGDNGSTFAATLTLKNQSDGNVTLGSDTFSYTKQSS
jgi:hypothetical protein